MLRCASSLVVAAYAKVRLTPPASRALPAGFLRSPPPLTAMMSFYEFVIFPPTVKQDCREIRRQGSVGGSDGLSLYPLKGSLSRRLQPPPTAIVSGGGRI